MGYFVEIACILMVSFLTATTAQDDQLSVSSPSSVFGSIMAEEMVKQQYSLSVRVHTLETSMATNKKDLQTTKKKLAATKNKLAATERDLASTKTDLASTKTDLAMTKTKLAATETHLASTKTDLASTKTDLASTKTDLAITKSKLAATETDLASTKTDLAMTKTKLAATETDLATTKTSLASTKTKLTATETDIASTKTALKAAETKLDTGLNSLKPGSSFIRWGRKSCPNNTSLVYVGVAGGKQYNQKGSGTNPLCLTRTPEFDNTAKPSDPWYGLLYGAEYQDIPGHLDHDVPCSVCLAPQSTTVMVPASKTCPPGWTPQYSGHLATQYTDHYATEYVCLDGSPEDDGVSNNNNGLMFYYTVTVCGSLPCPPYENNKVVTCVVCSK